jgi:hypothetical protein
MPGFCMPLSRENNRVLVSDVAQQGSRYSSSHTKIAQRQTLQNACKHRLVINMQAPPVLYRLGIGKTMSWR